jgi:hypothetical protein
MAASLRTAEHWADNVLSFKPDIESKDYWEHGLRSMTEPAHRKDASEHLGIDVEGDWQRTMGVMREIKGHTL